MTIREATRAEIEMQPAARREVWSLARAHAELTVIAPRDSRSRLWEVHFPGDGGVASFDGEFALVTCLRLYHKRVG